jgi:molybdenum cofactor guanylyltransferase
MPETSGLILAGGQGRRMGGVDKGLQYLKGRPLVEWVVERLEPQVDEIIISANQHIERYSQYGYRVAEDAITGFAGPLAGLHTGLTVCSTPLLATVPCDSPFLPLDLVQRLADTREDAEADLAVATTHGQAHPVFALMGIEVLDHLTRFLNGGGRKIDTWYATLRVVTVNFDDESEAFININTRVELDALDRR